MRVKLLLVTLAIKLVKGTDSKIKPAKPVLQGITNAWVGEKKKLWDRYQAAPDVEKGSNDTIFEFKSGIKSGECVHFLQFHLQKIVSSVFGSRIVNC